MWDLVVLIPDHCFSITFQCSKYKEKWHKEIYKVGIFFNIYNCVLLFSSNSVRQTYAFETYFRILFC